MVLTLIFSFLFNFIILISFGTFFSHLVVKIFTIFFVNICLLSCVYLVIDFLFDYDKFYILNLGNWISFDTLVVDWEFSIDSMNILMLFIVILISSLVHIYSWDYMKNDPHFTRFISYLSLFTFFMIILLAANNFIVMFIGWEGVGLSSYLLINFWYTRIQANKAAIKAMMINKIGDFALLVGMMLIFNVFQTFNYHEIFLLNYIYQTKMDLICFFIFIGCMGKSAQIGLHMWLPDAMEGPTPVSALIHAATMVTAGVFLVIRCSFMFEFAELTLSFMTIIGAITALFGATVGFMQYDIKKIIAYSTCSQLGLMFCACGLSAYSLGLFHLINHAFFKALLFLCAGSVIHALNDEQDIRKMGGLKNILPFTYISMLIASLSLMGFPYFSGFYSKELILLVSYLNHFQYSFFKFGLLYIASLLTVLYSLKILYNVFFNSPLGFKYKYIISHETNFIVLSVYSVLIFFSIFSGYLLKDYLIGYGSVYLTNSIFYLPKHYDLGYAEFVNPFIKVSVLFIPFIGLIIFNYIKDINYSNTKLYLIFLFLNKKYFFDRILNIFNIYVSKYSFDSLYFIFDKGFIENFIQNIIFNIFNISKIMTRNLSNYNLFFFLELFFYILTFLMFILILCIIFFLEIDDSFSIIDFFKRIFFK